MIASRNWVLKVRIQIVVFTILAPFNGWFGWAQVESGRPNVLMISEIAIGLEFRILWEFAR